VWGASGIVLVISLLFVLLPACPSTSSWQFVVGLVAGNGIAWFTEYYTAYTKKPTRSDRRRR
jgi:K(+)-stimulated pyrophosphate-energized sodium pump